MQIVTALGLLAGVFAFVPRDVLVLGVVWLVGQFDPSLAGTLLIGVLMMWS